MAIKYIHIEPQKKTIALLEGCKYDAVNKIKKIVDRTSGICIDYSKYMMHDNYRAVVVCCEDDEYSRQVGEERAKAKLMDHYYKQLDKTMQKFADDINNVMFMMVSEKTT